MKEPITWELVNPEGTIEVEALKVNPHPATLKNKTVLLHWNAKHNGDIFLNKVAEFLVDKVEGVKIIRSWEIAPETVRVVGTKEDARKNVRKLADFKPDLVIGSQGD